VGFFSAGLVAETNIPVTDGCSAGLLLSCGSRFLGNSLVTSDSPHSPQASPSWLWLHLLSLEAPLVAVVWAWALAHFHHLSIMPGVLPGLGLCVWIVYVLDRVMDGVGHSKEGLDRRHAFHRRWRWVLMILVVLASVWAGWLALWVVPSGLLWQCASLGVLMLLYLILFPAAGGGRFRWIVMPLTCLGTMSLAHALPFSPAFKLLMIVLAVGILALLIFRSLHRRLMTALSKDVVGGLLFALGCRAWTRFSLEGGEALSGTIELMLLSVLFISNLTGISSRESQGRWLGLGFGAVAGVLLLVLMGRVSESLGILAVATGFGLVLLVLLNWKRCDMSVDTYRVWADLAVLVPVLGLFICA